MREILLAGIDNSLDLIGESSLYFLFVMIKLIILSFIFNIILYKIYSVIYFSITKEQPKISFGDIFFKSNFGILIFTSLIYAILNIILYFFDFILYFINQDLYYFIYYILEDYSILFNFFINIYTLSIFSILLTWYLKLKKQI